MADQGKSKGSGQQTGEIPPLEWAVAFVGLVLVLSTIGFLLYQIVTDDDSPPEVSLTVGDVIEMEGGYLVEFNVLNRGGSTAARLMVQGELRDAGDSVETSQTEIDYVPPDSERSGGLFFTENPNDYELMLRPLGFQEP
jgi:uncharacterized protein (TIGR02588 family)